MAGIDLRWPELMRQIMRVLCVTELKKEKPFVTQNMLRELRYQKCATKFGVELWQISFA